MTNSSFLSCLVTLLDRIAPSSTLRNTTMTRTVAGVLDNVQASHTSAQQDESQSTPCEKAAKSFNQSPPTNLETGNVEPSEPAKPGKKLSFYLAVLSLMLVILIVSLDATALSVAIPVSWLVSKTFVADLCACLGHY